MTQFIRPNSQVGTTGQWRRETGATADMHLSVDEAVKNSADYIEALGTGIGGDPTEYRVDLGLGPGGDPAVQTGHVVNLWALRVGGGSVDIKVRLQSAVGVDVITEQYLTLTSSEVLYTYTLSSAEVTAFRSNGGYAGCTLRIAKTADSVSSRGARVVQCWLQYPDQGFVHFDYNFANGGLKVVPAASGHYLLRHPSGGGVIRVAGIEQAGIGVLVPDSQFRVVPS